jgi:hypothetical protein
VPDTYSILLILRIALVAILYLVIIRVVAVARREMRVVEREPSSVARGKNVVGHLVVIDNGSTALRPGARLDIEPVTTIGRSPTNTIVLDSTFVSTEHTRIIFRDKSLWVEDMSSRNGTLVNQARIPKDDAIAVTPGTILQVGDVRFKFAV